MAGFDFEVPSTIRQREFVKALLHQSQKLATQRGLTLKYRWTNDNLYYVTVDGPLMNMQVIVPMFITTMMVYASTTPTTSFSRNEFRRLASRVIDRYLKGIYEIEELVGDVSMQLEGEPNSLAFDVGKSTHLSGKIQSFSDTLVLYIEGRLGPDQIVEECHTILELLLRNALKIGTKKESFESMVNMAIGRRIINSKFRTPLIDLKNLRRNSKHKGQSISEERVQGFIWDSVTACHQLLRNFRKIRSS